MLRAPARLFSTVPPGVATLENISPGFHRPIKRFPPARRKCRAKLIRQLRIRKKYLQAPAGAGHGLPAKLLLRRPSTRTFGTEDPPAGAGNRPADCPGLHDWQSSNGPARKIRVCWSVFSGKARGFCGNRFQVLGAPILFGGGENTGATRAPGPVAKKPTHHSSG